VRLVTANRIVLYLLANLLFAGLVATATAMNAASGVHPAYLILLFALCSTPIIDMTAWNGPHVLLGIFSLNFFLFYGALDFSHLMSSQISSAGAQGFMSATECVILLGAALASIGYRLACRPMRTSRSTPPKDWPEIMLVIGGVSLWAVCSALNWEFAVHVVTEANSQAVARGLGSLTGLQTTVFMLAHMSQPLGILIIAYAQCRYGRGYMMPLLIGVVLFQLLFGFVIDFKGEAFLGGVLAILTKVLVDGRLPKVWLAAMLAFIAVGFPVLQANRVVVRGQHGENSTQVGQNIGKSLEEAIDARNKVSTGRDRSQTFVERMSLKGSVETIVTKTGDITPFQHGYTLAPLISAFVPRLIWPNKPDVAVGRLMNKEFRVSDVADTYISPSHLGDLYWNFGWAGVGVGMTLIGLLLGLVGSRFNLAQAVTVTRLMVIVVTIRLLILGSEGELATQYVVWIRSMAAIGVLHWLLARTPVAVLSAALLSAVPKTGRSQESGTDGHEAPLLFPNLLR
jgi:hypothetical protein